jgi:hypothetical protein
MRQFLPFILLVVAAGNAAAQAVPNPLIEPIRRAAGNLPVRGGAPSLDAPLSVRPDGRPFASAPAPVDIQGDVNGLRQMLSRFHVSAILGNSAVIKSIGGVTGAPAGSAPGPGAYPGGVSAAPAASASGSSAAYPASHREEIITLVNGEQQYIFGRFLVTPVVRGSDVLLQMGEGADRRAVFYGRVEAPQRWVAPPVVLEKPDSGYVGSLSPKSTATAGASTSAGSTSK